MTSWSQRILWVPLFVLTAVAQVPTAELTGTVTDPSGAVVAGAKVVITNVATNIERSTVTNEAGIYIAPALQPGTYSVRISQTGFRAAQRSEILLQVSQTARLDIQLEVGNVTETVEISALGGGPGHRDHHRRYGNRERGASRNCL